MEMIIIGALPPPPVAKDIAGHLEKTAPLLLRLFERATAKIHPADPEQTGCTPYEAWLVQQYGFTPEAHQNLSSALAPILQPGAHRDEATWLFQLAHFGLGTNGAYMLTDTDIAVSQDESLALYESAGDIFTDSPFQLKSCGPSGWTVALRESFMLPSRSPALIASGDLAVAWPQDDSTKPYRRLLSELQIAWHQHPVNETRRNNQLPPINGGWLFGGAKSSQLATSAPGQSQTILYELDAAFRQHHWGNWLGQLPALERAIAERLAPFLSSQDRRDPVNRPIRLILTGVDRWAELDIEPRTALLKWLPVQRKQWKSWWYQ